MPFNYKAISMVKEALAKRAGSFVPKSIYSPDKNVHPPIPGKATGQVDPFPSSGTVIRPSPNFASGLQSLKIPKGFHARSPELLDFIVSNYITEDLKPKNDLLNTKYYRPKARLYNYLDIHKNVPSPEQQEAMNLESRRLANIGLKNRVGNPVVFYNSPKNSHSAYDIKPMGQTTNADLLIWPSKTRNLILDSRAPLLREISKKLPYFIDVDGEIASNPPRGATLAHELEHAGAQRLPTVAEKLDEINREYRTLGRPSLNAGSFLSASPFLSKFLTLRGDDETDWSKNNLTVKESIGPGDMFRAETPAVLAELANQAQAAYLANGKKPLTGNFSIDPTGRFKIPMEDFRKQVERRGHVGGNHNVSMTDLLNSPEGQEFLRMNLQNARIMSRIGKQRAENINNMRKFYNFNLGSQMSPEDVKKQGPDYEEKKMLGWDGFSTKGQFRGY